MFNKLYLGVPRRIRLFIIFLLIILAVYFVGRFVFVRLNGIPQEFLKARQEASLISQVIVDLSSDSAKNIEDISNLDNNAQYIEALNIIVQEMEKNKEVREKAISLSSNLQTMARSASDIYPDSSASVALEAISVETTVISHLVNYNDYLNQLLEILRAKLLGRWNSNEEIKFLVDKVNEEAKIINELNQKFNLLMAEFDQS